MSLPMGLPAHSLGWGILDWITTYLAQPDGDRKGQTFLPTDEQALYIVWYYAIDEDGKFLYRRGILERPKRLG